MTSAIQLGRGAKTGRAGTNDGYFLSGADLGRLGDDPTFIPPMIDDGTFQVLDRDGRRIDAEDAGAFARCGTNAARELREIVGFMETIERFLPKTAIDQVVPFRNEVVNRAAGGHAVEKVAC